MQGDWSEVDYIGLSTNHLVELNDWKLEVLVMPTEWHRYRTLDVSPVTGLCRADEIRYGARCSGSCSYGGGKML